MNTSQKILAAIGGVALIAALVLAYLIWDASSVRAEKAEELEGLVKQARQVVGKLPMKPGDKSIEVYAANKQSYDEWRENAARIAASGDLVFEPTTEAALKGQLVNEARALADRVGRVNGKLVKPDFGFGFQDYIVGGKMPAKDDLKRLQREWNDVSTVLVILADAGAVELADVRMGAVKKAAEAAAEEEQPKSRKNKKRAKAKRAAEKAEAAEEASADAPAITAFSVDFFIRPDGLVRALNAIATDPRFIVVENIRFAREQDVLGEALGGDAKKREGGTSSSRRRRRGAAEVKETPAADAEKAGPVTDPLTDPPLKATLDVSVYDFRTLEKAKEEASTERDEGKGAESKPSAKKNAKEGTK